MQEVDFESLPMVTDAFEGVMASMLTLKITSELKIDDENLEDGDTMMKKTEDKSAEFDPNFDYAEYFKF